MNDRPSVRVGFGRLGGYAVARALRARLVLVAILSSAVFSTELLRGSDAQPAGPCLPGEPCDDGREPSALSDLLMYTDNILVFVNGRNSSFEELYQLSINSTFQRPETQDHMTLPVDGGAAYIGNRSRDSSVFYLSGENTTVFFRCTREEGDKDNPCVVNPTKKATSLGLRFLHLDNGAQVKFWWVAIKGWSAEGGAGILATDGAHANIKRTYFRKCSATGGAMGGGMLVMNASATFWHQSGFANCTAMLNSKPEITTESEDGLFEPNALSGVISQMLGHISSTGANSSGIGGGLAVVGNNAIFTARENTVWEDNEADFGGGMFIAQGRAVLTNHSEFIENSAFRAGGGLFAALGASVLMKRDSEEDDESQFEKNAAPIGGNVFLSHGADLLADSTNFLSGFGINSRQSIAGGNICLHNSSAHILGSNLLEGEANFGAAAMIDGGATLRMVGCAISENVAFKDGGAVHVTASSVVEVSNSIFSNNQAHESGGHIFLDSGSSLVSDLTSYEKGRAEKPRSISQDEEPAGNVFGGALAVLRGSTVWSRGDNFESNYASSAGGTLYSSASSLMIQNSTFSKSGVDEDGRGNVFHVVAGSLLSMMHVRIERSRLGGPQFSVGGINDSNLWLEDSSITDNGSRLTEYAIEMTSSNATLLHSKIDQGLFCHNHSQVYFTPDDSGLKIEPGSSIVECPPFSCAPNAGNALSFGMGVCLDSSVLFRFYGNNETAPLSGCAQEYVVPHRWTLLGAECPSSTGDLRNSCSAGSFVPVEDCLQSEFCPKTLPDLPPALDGTRGPSQAQSSFSPGIAAAIAVFASLCFLGCLAGAIIVLRRRARKRADEEMQVNNDKGKNAGTGNNNNVSLGALSTSEDGSVCIPLAHDVVASVVIGSTQSSSDASSASSQKQPGAAALLPLVSVSDTISMTHDTGNIDLTINFEAEIKPYLDPSRRIGSGGFGDVYKMPIRGRDSAVKVFTRGYTGATEEQYSSFIQELELMGKFQNCDQIVKIYGASVARPHVAIAYELVGGGSLADRIKKSRGPGGKKMTHLEILKAGYDIALGLAYLHPTVVHRDLKPGNVLIAENGTCKLIDFGVSRNKDPFESYLHTAAGGTPNYMAPEMFNNNQMDEKVDVYALGLILCEMVTGKTAWDDCDNFAQIVMAVAIMAERPEIPEGVPKPLQRLITKCWHDDSHKRPSAPEVARQLQYMIKEEEEQAAVSQGGAAAPATDAAADPGRAQERQRSTVEAVPSIPVSEGSSEGGGEPNSAEQADRAQMIRRRLEQVATAMNSSLDGPEKPISRAESGIKELLDQVVKVETHGQFRSVRSQHYDSPPGKPKAPLRAQSSRFEE